MKKVINRFQYIDCTAIAISAGDAVRQIPCLSAILKQLREMLIPFFSGGM